MHVAVVDRTGVFQTIEVELPPTVAAQDAIALELYERGADYRLIGSLIGRTRTVAHRRVRRALRAIAPEVERRGFHLMKPVQSGTRKFSWHPPHSLLERRYRLRGDAFGEVVLPGTRRGHSHGRARSSGAILFGAFDSQHRPGLDCRALLRWAVDWTPFVELLYCRRRDHRPVGRRRRIACRDNADRVDCARRELLRLRRDDRARARRRSSARGLRP